MRSNSAKLLILAACAYGCKGGGPLVWVDAGRLAAAEPVPAIDGVAPSQQAPKSAPVTASVFGLQDSPEVRGALGREAQNAKDTLTHGRELALRALREKLFRALRKDVDAWRTAEQEKLEAQLEGYFEHAYQAIGTRLREIAPERGKLLNQMALRNAFPIPPPQSWTPVPADSPWRLRARARDLEAYNRIVQIDADFAKEAQAIVDRTADLAERLVGEFQLAYADRLDSALRQANSEAEATLRSSNGQFESALADLAIQPRVSAPRRQVVVEPPARNPGGPVSTASSMAPAIRARARIMTDIRVWAGLKGYRLSDSPGAGRDATEEFAAWRRSHRPGP